MVGTETALHPLAYIRTGSVLGSHVIIFVSVHEDRRSIFHAITRPTIFPLTFSYSARLLHVGHSCTFAACRPMNVSCAKNYYSVRKLQTYFLSSPLPVGHKEGQRRHWVFKYCTTHSTQLPEPENNKETHYKLLHPRSFLIRRGTIQNGSTLLVDTHIHTYIAHCQQHSPSVYTIEKRPFTQRLGRRVKRTTIPRTYVYERRYSALLHARTFSTIKYNRENSYHSNNNRCERHYQTT